MDYGPIKAGRLFLIINMFLAHYQQVHPKNSFTTYKIAIINSKISYSEGNSGTVLFRGIPLILKNTLYLIQQ